MELIGYYNYEDKLNYDQNNFLINVENNSNNIVYFDFDESKNKSNIGQSIFSFSLNSKDENKYVYDVMIKEQTNTAEFVAIGKVEIYYNIVDSNIKFKQILVNGVINGPLHDKYNDCFIIYIETYLHLLVKN